MNQAIQNKNMDIEPLIKQLNKIIYPVRILSESIRPDGNMFHQFFESGVYRNKHCLISL